MKKIVFHLNCLEQGGAERVVSNLANQFSTGDYEVIVATEWTGAKEFALNEKVRRVHVGMTARDEQKGRLYKAIKRVTNLRKLLKREKPDMVIAFMHNPIYRALCATIGTKIPVIIAVRTDPIGHYDSKKDKILIPILYPRAVGCVFQTEWQRDFFPDYVREKSKVILNPINPKYIGVTRENPRKKEVVHSGRLTGFKNHQLLIKAFLEVHQKHPDYILKLYGKDSFDGTKEKIIQLIEEKDAGDYVKMMGPSDSLEKELLDASVYVLSSDWEGLPNALMEAMALGLPCVSTDCPCGGPRSIVQNGDNGLLVPIKDQQALVEAMNRLIENPEFAEQLGENAKEIKEIANIEAIYSEWKKFIDSLCQ